MKHSTLRTPSRSLTLVAATLALAACHKTPHADQHTASAETFRSGMVAYLKARGDLCLGKTEFPIDVSQAEFQKGSRDALQMPALEHLGIVSSIQAVGTRDTEDGPVAVDVRRYNLTDAGRRYYLSREVTGQQTSDGKPVFRSDLCVAKLSLDKIVGWQVTGSSATVTYTYHVDAAPWTQNSEITQVFPMVARVVTGAGSNQLKEGFTLTPAGWVANELVPPAPQAPPAVANR